MSKGKTALITGSTSGIGQGIAEALAAQGCNIVLNGFGDAGQIEALRTKIARAHDVTVLHDGADMSKGDAITAMMDKAIKEFGAVDIFVNNAGIMILGTVDSYSLEDLDRMLAVNVRAAFVGIQAASQAMKNGGRIILIGSNSAVRTAFPGASVYSMTKAALTGLVRGAAIDLAPRTITVNNIQPGPTATDMSAPHAEAVKTLIPLARMADVSEIAGFVSYLASDEAGFITGASLTIDGGYIA